jgi:hypothetical protein
MVCVVLLEKRCNFYILFFWGYFFTFSTSSLGRVRVSQLNSLAKNLLPMVHEARLDDCDVLINDQTEELVIH